ncbi:MAG TPA: T9SS type A sorting domain-containing protein, partial [Bacteroidales bacterium]|nr:T9SS type A sorting domain-containing protein [Bacteroidales bacterium]HQD35012.1 T9SS type A sorting domain-containing protein [Bacteroidales bacterium]
KCLGGTDHDFAYSIQQTSDGGFIVAGLTGSNDGDVSGNHGGSDAWVVKLNSSGEIEWQKCLGGTNYDFAYSIQQTSDGGFIVASITGSNDGDVSGNHGGSDYWVVKLNSSGGIEWQKCLGGTNSDGGIFNDYIYSIQQTSDGGFIMACETMSNDGDVSGNHGSYDAWVVKLNSLGDIEWQKCLGGTNRDIANSIQQTSDGGFIVAGSTSSNDGDVSGNHGYGDAWVVKLNSSGDIEWQKCLGGTNSDWAYSIQQTNDSGFIVAGYTHSNNGDVSGNHGYYDYWVVKLNSSGDIEWQKCIGGTNYEFANSIQQTSDGGFIVAGETLSNNGDVSGNHGYSDAWVVKLTNEPDRINEIENYNLLSIYPNPFTEYAIITFDNPKKEKYRLLITDVTGKVVMEINEIYGDRVEIDGSNLSAGVYVFELTCGQCVLAGKEGEKLFRGRFVVE